MYLDFERLSDSCWFGIGSGRFECFNYLEVYEDKIVHLGIVSSKASLWRLRNLWLHQTLACPCSSRFPAMRFPVAGRQLIVFCVFAKNQNHWVCIIAADYTNDVLRLGLQIRTTGSALQQRNAEYTNDILRLGLHYSCRLYTTERAELNGILTNYCI